MPDTDKPVQATTDAEAAFLAKQPRAVRDHHWRLAIIRQTPPEVWAAYRADGVRFWDAVRMEVAYGG